MSEESSTDCRSEAGITVGLIDSLIAIARVLKPRLHTDHVGAPADHAIIQALEDLNADEDIAHILRWAESAEHRCTTERCLCTPPNYHDDEDDYYPDPEDANYEFAREEERAKGRSYSTFVCRYDHNAPEPRTFEEFLDLCARFVAKTESVECSTLWGRESKDEEPDIVSVFGLFFVEQDGYFGELFVLSDERAKQAQKFFDFRAETRGALSIGAAMKELGRDEVTRLLKKYR